MRRSAPVVALVLLGSVLAGCSQAKVEADGDLCAQYRELDARVASLAAVDPDTVTADELREQAEAAQQQLDAFQATTEGRLDTAISALRSAVNDLAVSAAAATQEALDTARPAIEDALDDVDEAWARVGSLADTYCQEA
ncbi:hypothetical protein ASC77_24520 [Nocardioides sp. Root1257]|uniref:hypothetical protein n=1 Tax=unclassified Nocardioides TaxID=2615069 RepID=UPI0006F1E2A9|nr:MULTISPECIES: hypothetical protein [unclassified Nocardioides]KQW52541.1 hypothetical protein ASC77_24520 [Nocardioides sp. Root1257]KRC54604.1 hypothetical protein ASE24_24310 [Nocardioides sp. Root224]